MPIQDLLQLTISRRASDLHLVTSYPPLLRVDGNLAPTQSPPLRQEDVVSFISPLLSPEQKERFEKNHELDFGYSFAQSRFRINVYVQKGNWAAAFRLIPGGIPSIEELNLPAICHNLVSLKQGFVIVTGPTGHGKSTTIAAIIEEINQKVGGHILTIEDPIEYLYTAGLAVVSQREVGSDTFSWPAALRAALRQDPNVVLVGEMRDFETIAAALTIAETGHLVFATLHTNSAAQTVDRIVDVFPQNQQAQVRTQLAATLEAVISQRLVPAISVGRVPVCEVLLTTPALSNVIREGKSHLIDNIIQTSADLGMTTFDTSLANLISKGQITYETAQTYALNPQDLQRLIKKV